MKQPKFSTREARDLYDQVSHYEAQMDKIRKTRPESLDRHYLVFAYNYFDVGAPEQALKTLTKITPGYYWNILMSDIESAVASRNEAETYKNNPLKADAYKKCMDASEFLIVIVRLANILLKQESFFLKDEFLAFYNNELVGKEFVLNVVPDVKSVNPRELH